MSKISFIKISVFVVVLSVGFLIKDYSNLLPALAQQNQTSSVVGSAWSSNVGWINFSGKSDAGSSYGVIIDSTGLFSGSAWSSNVGWISFSQGDLVGCPAAPCNAKVSFTLTKDPSGKSYYPVSGWAKALASKEWINLSGVSGDGSSYGVMLGAADSSGKSQSACLAAGNLCGLAWGKQVVGWLSFRGTDANNNQYGVNINGVPTSCSFSANPSSLVLSGLSGNQAKSVLSWNCPADVMKNSCYLSSSDGSISNQGPANSGTKSVTVKKTTVYTLVCSKIDGIVANEAKVTVLTTNIKEIKPQ